MDPLIELNEKRGGKLLPAMLAAFLDEECPAGMRRLRKGIVAADHGAVARAAHALRGSSAVFGAAALVDVCAEIESYARAGTLTPVGKLMGRLEAELAQTSHALARYRSG